MDLELLRNEIDEKLGKIFPIIKKKDRVILESKIQKDKPVKGIDYSLSIKAVELLNDRIYIFKPPISDERYYKVYCKITSANVFFGKDEKAKTLTEFREFSFNSLSRAYNDIKALKEFKYVNLSSHKITVLRVLNKLLDLLIGGSTKELHNVEDKAALSFIETIEKKCGEYLKPIARDYEETLVSVLYKLWNDNCDNVLFLIKDLSLLYHILPTLVYLKNAGELHPEHKKNITFIIKPKNTLLFTKYPEACTLYHAGFQLILINPYAPVKFPGMYTFTNLIDDKLNIDEITKEIVEIGIEGVNNKVYINKFRNKTFERKYLSEELLSTDKKRDAWEDLNNLIGLKTSVVIKKEVKEIIKSYESNDNYLKHIVNIKNSSEINFENNIYYNQKLAKFDIEVVDIEELRFLTNHVPLYKTYQNFKLLYKFVIDNKKDYYVPNELFWRIENGDTAIFKNTYLFDESYPLYTVPVVEVNPTINNKGRLQVIEGACRIRLITKLNPEIKKVNVLTIRGLTANLFQTADPLKTRHGNEIEKWEGNLFRFGDIKIEEKTYASNDIIYKELRRFEKICRTIPKNKIEEFKNVVVSTGFIDEETIKLYNDVIFKRNNFK